MTPAEIYEVSVGFMVRSKSVDGAWRLVSGDSCSCPARVRICRHRQLVDAHLLERNRKNARPTAPANVAALCD